MNFKKSFVVLAAIVAMTQFNASGPSALAQGNGARPVAFGQGMIHNAGPNGENRNFSFHVNEMPDGSLQGNGHLISGGGEQYIFFDVNSYTVDSFGNTWIAGPITSAYEGFVNDLGYEPGAALFCVQDGGRGREGDAISLLFLPPPEQFDGNGNLVQLSNIDEIIAFLASLGLPPNADALFFALGGADNPIDAGNITVR